MAIDWSQLSALPGNPLFDLGIGLMANSGAAPYGTTLGQRFAGALGDMGQIQKSIADQQYVQQQRDQAEQDRQDLQARRQKLNDALQNSPYANDATFQAMAAANPEAAAAWALKQQQTDKQNASIRQAIFGAPGQPGFTAPQVAAPTGLPSGLPAETQAYVPKVMNALGGAPAFQNGQPTPQLLDAVQHVESGGSPNAVSPAGAQGAFQLMPATAASVGVANPMDPVQARAGASRYFAQLAQQFPNDPQAAIAAYNAGPGRVSAAMANGAPAAPAQNPLLSNPAFRALAAADPAAALKLEVEQATKAAPDAKPSQIAQRMQNWQQLVAAGAVDPSNTQMRSQYLLTGKADGGAFNANQPRQLGDPKLDGDQYLASIDPTDRATVLAAMQGRMKPPSGTASKSSYWMGVMNAVRKVDPTFDETTWESRYKTAQAYSPGGTFGQQANALNTLINHANGWLTSVSGLHNTGSPLLNSIANRVAYDTGMGAQTLPAVQTNSQALADEIESLWKKGGGSEEQIKQYASALSPNMSPAAAKATISKVLELATGKLNSMQKQYTNAMGSGAQPLQFVNPQSQKIVESLDPDLAKAIGADATAPAAGAIANPGAAGHTGVPPVGSVQGGYRFTGGDPANPSSWQRVQ